MKTNNLGDNPSGTYNSTTSFYEGNISALLDIVNFKRKSTGKNIAQIYVGAGIGYAIANLQYSNSNSKSPNSTNTIIVPLCIGCRVYINPLIDLGIEYFIHQTFTDELDGFTPQGYSNRSNDWYSLTQIYISFNMGKNKNTRNVEWIEPTEILYEELVKAKQEAQQKNNELREENSKLKKELDVLASRVNENKTQSDSVFISIKKIFQTDSDGDGVADEFDKEPNTPQGANIDGAGRTIDSDKDGIPDYKDKCPTIFGRDINNGCPIELSAQQLAVIYEVKRTLRFETGKAIITSSSYPALDNLVEMLLENISFNFKIEGHTDNVGDSKSNLDLSIQRANAVKTYISSKGIELNRIIAIGYGDTKPMVSNNTAIGRAKNRRVDMSIE
jgi:outer membrane protein OmpA-like peptidoglycan-associated protein